jgi:hypothetical protein
MNLKEITKNILAEAKKLENGSDPVKQFAKKLTTIAKQMDEYRKANELPIKPRELRVSKKNPADFFGS